MGVIADIENLVKKSTEFAGSVNSMKINTKSVARGANDSTFQFPCLVADSLPTDMASTMARTLDQVYATFTQTWLSMNSMFDISVDQTPSNYLKKLHQNIKFEEVEFDDENDKAIYYLNESKSLFLEFTGVKSVSTQIRDKNRELLKNPLSHYNTKPIVNFNEADEEETAMNAADFAKAVVDGTALKNQNDRRDKRLAQTERLQAPKLVDRDIKKNNDLVPYGIQVRLIAVNDKKEFVQYVDFIVGVKTVLHLVKSQDMIDNIVKCLQNKSVLFKLLRWTTGEISLFKDIIFNLNDIKQDAINKRSGKSIFFNKLKRLKNKKVEPDSFSLVRKIIPNSTIIVTSYEAENILNNYGIDIRKESNAKKILSSLFLMAFVIVDEGTGLVSILYDGESTFQNYSIETLEKDNAIHSNKLGREIGRMIAR